MKIKLLIALAVIIAIFIITNPSTSSFKEHLGKTSYNGLVRKYNFFLFSRYINQEDGARYTGVLGNFVGAKKSVPEIDYSHAVIMDSVTISSNAIDSSGDRNNPFADLPSGKTVSNKHKHSSVATNNLLIKSLIKYKKEHNLAN